MKPLHFILPLALAGTAFAQIPEPDVVFYGRILHQGGGEDYLLTRGTLEWRVDANRGSADTPNRGSAVPADRDAGVPPAFQAQVALTPLKGGAYSYQLRVPQRLAVSGLRPNDELPGLPVTDALYQNTEVRVNGQPAKFLDPTSRSFSATRGSFRRLDLAVGGSLADADGDGLPDWWEEKYGLDAKTANANNDPDGDKANNLAEYRAGTDPTGADQEPKLPEEIWLSLPLGARAVPFLQAKDRDSTREHLVYTLGPIADGLRVSVLPGLAFGQGPRSLTSGQNFTQAEVDAGAIVIAETTGRPGAFEIPLTLRDETPGHAPAKTTLRVTTADLATVWEASGLPSSAKPEAKVVFQDAGRSATGVTLHTPSGPVELDEVLPAEDYAAHKSAHGPDASRVMLGSSVKDVLLGSGESDLLVLGDGDTARGYVGADRFLVPAKGQVTITDFSAEQHDTIDLRAALTPTPNRPLSAYLSLVGSELRVDADGDGSGLTDLTISLPGAVLPSQDLAELWDQGLLETGEIAPRLTLFATTKDQAAEEGLKPGRFVLRRRGNASEALTVSLTWSGTATSGRDYEALPSQATFPAGQKTLEIVAKPLADDEREPAETIQLAVASHSVYDLADGGRASLTLADLPTRVWLELAEAVAYQDSLSPAQVLLRRSGPLATPLTVTLQVSGRATAGVDYRRLPGAVTFPANQATTQIDIVPLANASLSKGSEDVLVTVRADAAYELGSASVRVVLAQKPRDISAWLAAKGLGDQEEEAFLQSDTDRDGLTGLTEFAFDLNPRSKQDAAPVRLVRDAQGKLGLEFSRWPDAPGLRYQPESSADLKTWSALEATETVLEILTNGQERLRLVPTKTEAKHYFRVHVRRD